MQPAGPLMIEHRLIERIVPVLRAEVKRLDQEKTIDRKFIETVVDFFRTYADRTHHGKEEDILFVALGKKKLSAEHRKTLKQLLDEHVFARKNVKKLFEAQDAKTVIAQLKILSELYPKHIETEDKHFFLPVMDYFSRQEQDEMLKQMWEFDKQLIHERYGKVMEGLENGR
jgi:hemerythrin-like domain-containing protein